MENFPLEDHIDILPKSEAEESRAWFNNSLVQLGQVFVDRVADMNENVSWDLIQREDRLAVRAINRVIGRTSQNSLRGKHILSYGDYRQHNHSCQNHLYVLEDGGILSVKEQTVIFGPNHGQKTFSSFEGHSIYPQLTFKEAQNTLNNIIGNMNSYLNQPLEYIGHE